MKLTIKTAVFQSLVSRAMKGASNNKMIPITSLMAIRLEDGKLTLVTTDATNYLYVTEDKVVGEDFYVVVQADMFSKLVARMTCESITLENTGDSLRVSGNGTYRIELPLDEEGEPITYPDPIAKPFEATESREVNLSTFKLILNTAKASLADSLEVPCYMGYYVGDNIVTTDTFKMCGIDIKLWDKPALISAEMMDLFNIFTDEKILVEKNDSVIIFSTPSATVYGNLMDCINDYQIDVINGLLSDEFSSKCTVSKTRLLQLLDRLALFVSPYDKNAIALTFTKSGIQVDSKQDNSTELIEYLESDNFEPYTCMIDIEMFKDQVKANTGDSICIEYGKENALKLSDGNVTQIIALVVE